MNELKIAFGKLTSETEETTNAIIDFSESILAIKQRYHPLVWWIGEAYERYCCKKELGRI